MQNNETPNAENNVLTFKKRRTLTPAEQASLEAGLRTDYDFEEVRFDKQIGEPIFSLKELKLLTTRLFAELDFAQVDTPVGDGNGNITVGVLFRLRNGIGFKGAASVGIGVGLPNGDIINTENQAIGLAEARAWRNAMDGTGFDLVKTLLAIYAPKTETEVGASAEEHSVLTANSEAIAASRKRAALVSTAKKCGYDSEAFRTLLSHNFGTTSTMDLTAEQCAALTNSLEADLRLRAYQRQQAA